MNTQLGWFESGRRQHSIFLVPRRSRDSRFFRRESRAVLRHVKSLKKTRCVEFELPPGGTAK